MPGGQAAPCGRTAHLVAVSGRAPPFGGVCWGEVGPLWCRLPIGDTRGSCRKPPIPGALSNMPVTDPDAHDDFREIEHSGGWVRIGAGGRSQRFTCVSPGRVVAVTAFGMAFTGEVLCWVPMEGLGSPIRCPRPSILVYLASDREGFWGRRCPACRRYFRVDAIRETSHCAYCLLHETSTAFFTENQEAYLQRYLEAYLASVKDDADTVLHLDEVTGTLPANHFPASYREERQQSRHKCGCKTTVDFIGMFANCPTCGRPNWREVWASRRSHLQSRLAEGEGQSERDRRTEAWRDVVEGGVSEFETISKRVSFVLAQHPLTPRRRQLLDDANCQSFDSIGNALREAVGVDLTAGWPSDDVAFVRRMFGARHCFTHSGGVIDQKYLDCTERRSGLGTLLRIDSNEARRFLAIIDRLVAALFDGFDSITVEHRT